MGRVNQAMRRARQSGIATEFESIAVSAYDMSVLTAEPFPTEAAQEPAVAVAPAPAPDPPTPAVVARDDDQDIKELFFNTYSEKVWDGPTEEETRLLRLLAKVEKRQTR